MHDPQADSDADYVARLAELLAAKAGEDGLLALRIVHYDPVAAADRLRRHLLWERWIASGQWKLARPVD